MKILVAGDFCPKQRIADLIEKGNYEAIFGQVKPVVAQSDFSIVNFECPVCSTECNNIKKAGPSLKCSSRAVDALRYAGFDCATLANNHFYDQGEAGVKETIQALTEAGIDHVGGGKDLEEAESILYHTASDKTIAIINCCEHEFSIATEKTGGSNPLSPIRQYYAICEARKRADYVLVIVHGGIEHYQYPTPRMVDTYRFFIDAGADAVVNHHQHCFSGYEMYQGKPVFYGLGNYCFDWKERHTALWEEGFMVMLDFEESGITFQLYPYNQNGKEAGVHLKEGTAFADWKQRFDAISAVIADKRKLKEVYDDFLVRTERRYMARLTPYSNRFLVASYLRGFLPDLFPKRKLPVLLNTLLCESHYDRMVEMLRNKTK